MPQSSALFIVGYPRSGTKLLRDLLNNHPDISLGGEGNFIPFITRRVGLKADVSNPQIWPMIYQALSETSTYNVEAEKGINLPEEVFIQALAQQNRKEPVTWAHIYYTIFSAYRPQPTAYIFGDKSHRYISEVPLLRAVFNNLRLILIVRDPRDQALSVLRTWKRSPLRSAQGWYKMAQVAEKHGVGVSPDILVVRYEDLTKNTAEELTRVCVFLGIPFQSGMVALKKPVENRRQELAVTANPAAKYKRGLTPALTRQISEITLPYLATYNYPEEGVTRHRRLSKFRLEWLKYQDGWSSMRYHIKEKGLSKGVSYYLSRHFDK